MMGYDECPDCRAEVAQDGPTVWDDRGPFQLISIRKYMCGCGRRWTHMTDGG